MHKKLKMTKLGCIGELGCVSSLFHCFGSSSSKKKHNTDGNGIAIPQAQDERSNKSYKAKKRTILTGSIPKSRSHSPHISSSASAVSGKSSVYFDASEGGSEAWHSVNGNDSFDNVDNDGFASLHIDGQYFFSAKDDPSISSEVYEGIQMYPPLPTTKPDPLPRSRISVSNMETLLHRYQHRDDDTEAIISDEEADIAARKAGIALEHQARVMMSDDKGSSMDALEESTTLLIKELSVKNVREKGFPGELTDIELEAVKLFQSELQKRDPIYYQIVRSFSAIEKEAYALCRFLRARKFDVEKVFELLDEAKKHYTNAKQNDFYPDLEQSLGVSRPVFLSQYPAVFAGNAKNGCPVMYLKVGDIQPPGIKCIVTFDKVDCFFWNDIMYSLVGALKEGRRINPQFSRTENITVYDLKGISRSIADKDAFEMIKIGNNVMTSFPETLHCLLIINAPTWFGMIWSIVKKLIDARTASKIEVFTSANAGSKRMLELIDNSQIPSCYGGSAPSLAESAASSASSPNRGRSKMVVLNHLLPLTKKKAANTYDFDLTDSNHITLTVYTRCKSGATATLIRNDKENASPGALVTEIIIFGDEEDDTPYCRTIGAIQGPGSFTLELEAKSNPGVFLILGTSSV